MSCATKLESKPRRGWWDPPRGSPQVRHTGSNLDLQLIVWDGKEFYGTERSAGSDALARCPKWVELSDALLVSENCLSVWGSLHRDTHTHMHTLEMGLSTQQTLFANGSTHMPWKASHSAAGGAGDGELGHAGVFLHPETVPTAMQDAYADRCPFGALALRPRSTAAQVTWWLRVFLASTLWWFPFRSRKTIHKA